MKKYDSYKNSGIEWLGKIPKHWKTERNKEVFYEISDLKSKGTETLLTVSHITGVTPRSEKNVNMFFAETMEGYKKAKKDDLIINTMWAWMGALGISNYDGICSPAYNVYRINNTYFNVKYFDMLCRMPIFIGEMAKNSKGIVESRLRLYPKDFFKIHICSPPLKEQIAIAEYLDSKTQAIGKKINILEQKITHYKDLRKSLINQVVTKGLDKNVKLKDSGIDWIRKIPEHWEIKRLKHLGNLETSSVNKKIEEDEVLVKLVNYKDIYNNLTKEIRNNEEYMLVSANNLQLQFKKLKKGDVLFTPSSETIEDIGISAVVMENLNNTLYSYHILRLRFTKQMNDSFKKYMFNNDFVQNYFSKTSKGTTRKILGLNDFNSLLVIVPPLKEQILIGEFLDKKTNLIISIITNIENQIKALKELRKTLINDVVTGKIKVV